MSTAAPNRGFGLSLGIGKENSWGTAVARAYWKALKSCGIRRMPKFVPVDQLGQYGQASTNHRNSYQQSDFCGGPFSFVACYDDATQLLMRYALGGNATTGSGPYTHTQTLASPVPDGGLTLEVIKGTAGAYANVAEVFRGCKLNGVKLTATAGGLLMVETEAIAKTSGGETTPGTPTYSSNGEFVRAHQSGVIEIGGTPVPVNSVTYTLERNLVRNQEIGSLYTSEPYENDRIKVSVELRAKWQQGTLLTNYLAGTQADIVQVFTGSGSKTLTITAHNCQVDDLTQETNGAGAVEQVCKLTAYADATDQGLALAWVNGNSSVDTN